MLKLRQSRSQLVFCKVATYQLDLVGPPLILSVTIVIMFVLLTAILVVFWI